MDTRPMLNAMLSRRSVSPKRLCAPGPSRDELGWMVDAALRAPDHAGLVPWRFIEFPDCKRGALAELFEAEKRRRDPLVSADDIARAREHATRAPLLLAFVVRPERHVLVPEHEQWLSAGAALGNFLMAAHTLGYGAIVLSGERCQDEALRGALGLVQTETLAGFVSVGAVAKAPPPASKPPRARVLSAWEPTPTATDLLSRSTATS